MFYLPILTSFFCSFDIRRAFSFFVEQDMKTYKVHKKVLLAILCVETGLHRGVVVCFGFACI